MSEGGVAAEAPGLARARGARVVPALGVGAIWLFLLVFLVYPLLRIFYDAFSDEAGRLTLANFAEFAGDRFYLRSLWNSILLGAGTVAAASGLGFAIAFLLVRYDFRGRSLFSYLTLIPIISPPLVGVLGFTFILGRAGTVNVLLEDWFGLARPVNFVYGLHGVLLVEALHLFPMITLNVVDALGKIDPALEEAAESVGARGWRKLRTITLPLTTPGYVAGALLVFIWTFSDFATPLVLGVHDLLAPQAYLNIVQFVDRRLFRMGIVISALMVALAVVFLVAARQYVAIKDYSSLTYSRIARRRLGPLGQAGAIAFLSLVLLLSFIPYLGVFLASVGKGWSLTPFPVRYTLQYFERVIVETPKYVVNSFLYAGLAVLLCIVVGVPIAWILARTRVPGRDTLDGLNTLILAVPGTAIGIAYVRAFHVPIPGFERGLTSLWIILPLVLAIRRLPYTVRGSYASLLLVHRSMEEAAASVGASGPRSFRDVTLPLIWRGVLVGSLFSFMTSLQEASAVLFLSLGGWETITVGIFSFYIAGSANEAAALGVILIVVAAVSVAVINRVAGARMGGMFG
ncbi:MAG: iron ABC transporter permease [Candidatus Rokubacteria bacterium]|nr:iron ABC transporter permease [Candidatus Rokubacteria bacterium]MBI2156938.1 iron ABC transporter permease [Candidatus Rokubacteria bacterium]